MAVSTEKDSADLAHFKSIPWCAAYLKDPDIIAVVPISRHIKLSGEDNLFSKALNTPGTISNFIVVHREPQSSETGIQELRAFLTLNSDISGFPGVCHGGIVATILDEVIGSLLQVNKMRGAVPNVVYMTAYLNTTYMSPVRLPGTIMVTSKVALIEGRRHYLEAVVEDESQTTLAKASALFVALKHAL